MRGPSGMGLDRDDPRPDLDQRAGQGTEAGSDIDDEIAVADPRVSDEALGPPGIELVPPPRSP